MEDSSSDKEQPPSSPQRVEWCPCTPGVGEEETRLLPCIHPLQDFQAVLRGATQQFLNGLWFCDIKTLEEGAAEVLSKERESQEALESQHQRRAETHICSQALSAPPFTHVPGRPAPTRRVTHTPPPPPGAPGTLAALSIAPRVQSPSSAAPAARHSPSFTDAPSERKR